MHLAQEINQQACCLKLHPSDRAQRFVIAMMPSGYTDALAMESVGSWKQSRCNSLSEILQKLSWDASRHPVNIGKSDPNATAWENLISKIWLGDYKNVEMCLPIKRRGIEDVVSISRRKFTNTPTQTLTLLTIHHLLYTFLSAASWGRGLILWRNGP